MQRSTLDAFSIFITIASEVRRPVKYQRRFDSYPHCAVETFARFRAGFQIVVAIGRFILKVAFGC